MAPPRSHPVEFSGSRPLWFFVIGLFAATVAVPSVMAAQEPGNLPPLPGFDAQPVAPRLHEWIAFESSSADPDGTIVNWTWDFGDGAVAYGAQAGHAYAEPGEFIVQLTVTDNQGASAQAGRAFEIPVELSGLRAAANLLPAWLYWLMPFLVSLVLFSLSYLVVAKGQPNIYNLVFFLLYVASGLKSLTEAIAVLTVSAAPLAHSIAIQANAAAAFVQVPLFLWFVLVFPRPIHPWLREGKRGALVLLLAVPFLIASLSGLITYESLVNIFNVYVTIFALLGLGILVYHGWETDSNEERQRIRLLSITFLLLVISSIILAVLNILASLYADVGNAEQALTFLQSAGLFGLVAAPLLEILGAAILVFSILKFQLLGIDLIVMRVTRGALTALLVPATFVIVSNTIEQLVQVTVLEGVQFDFLVAGFVSAALMFPIQKWVTFLIYRLFPGIADHAPLALSMRRMEIFEAQLRYCLLDGAVNQKELGMLRRLRQSIDLTPDEFDRVLKQFPSVDRAGFMAVPGAEERSTGVAA